MKLLLSNDDGVDAPGIQALFQAFSQHEAVKELVLMAPDSNRSGVSKSLTLNEPLRIKPYADQQYSVSGTPTDCVHIALTGFLDELPDMVISGINRFSNLGDDTLYSGTVAAAVEGRFLGLPSIAVSLNGDTHYDAAARVTVDIFNHCLKKPLKQSIILNVNVPDVPYESITGYEVTRLGTRHVSQPFIKQTDPRGGDMYWIGPAGDADDDAPGTDFHAVSQSRVSITPLQVDMTDNDNLDYITKWLW